MAIKRTIQLITPLAFRGMLSSSRMGARVVPIDGSWYMPNNPRDPVSEFKKERLANARFFDLDGVKDNESSFPHMLPPVEQFNKSMGELGIEKSDRLVVYDKVGNFSAPRVAWTLQMFGHDNVYLLNNFPLYQKYSYPLETSHVGSVEPTTYESTQFDSDGVLSFEQVLDIVSDESKRSGYTILDARSRGRFTGEDPEPRPGLPSGYAPGAKSLPFSRVLDSDNLFLPKDQLVSIFKELEIPEDKPVIVMCGTGVTACILKAALDSAGYNKGGVQVYDGSWTEYAQRAPEELIVKGD